MVTELNWSVITEATDAIKLKSTITGKVHCHMWGKR
jgi:hypothetical protein